MTAKELRQNIKYINMEADNGERVIFNVLPEWIPVSEKLPEENEYIGDVCKYYLIQDEYGDMHVAHLSNVGWIPMDSLKAIGAEVIAWMPLPEPYMAESEAQDADKCTYEETGCGSCKMQLNCQKQSQESEDKE